MTQRPENHVRMFRTVKNTLDLPDIMSNVSKILVAYSGGVDSSVLLHLMKDYHHAFGINVSVAHINHGLRGKESDRDADFCRETAREMGFHFYLKKLSLGKKHVSEHVLRSERYRSLCQVAKEAQAQRIFLAHHLDDQVETLLFRLFTGTDISGLSGIQPFRKPYFVRPLLKIPRNAILLEAELCQISYVLDSSNLLTHPKRNFIRRQLIPLIQTQMNPQVSKHLAYLSESFNACKVLIAKEVAALKRSAISGENRYSITQFKLAPKIIQSQLIMNLYREAVSGYSGLRREQIMLARKLLLSKKNEAYVQLPKGIICRKQGDFFLMENAKKGAKS
ncbi:MAG: tRNA lysidine(34) synthetase TilS [Bdellovibrionales bacterium]|nr:tRNA lysidine(34) synthetase TilS [Bdellovibrionales bacterium]